MTVILLTALFWWLKTGDIVTVTICDDFISFTNINVTELAVLAEIVQPTLMMAMASNDL